MNFIVKILISGLIAFVLSKILSGIHFDSIFKAILFAFILSILDAIVKPILVFLTLPITFVTLGLFLLVINASMIMLAANLIHGIRVDSFGWAILFSIILSIFNAAAQNKLNDDKA